MLPICWIRGVLRPVLEIYQQWKSLVTFARMALIGVIGTEALKLSLKENKTGGMDKCY